MGSKRIQDKSALASRQRREWTKYAGNPILPKATWGPCAPCVVDAGENAYRMYYHADLPDGSVGINLAFASADRPCEWTDFEKNPVFPPAAADSHMVRYCRVVRVTGSTWYMYYTGSPKQRKEGELNWNAGMAISKDDGLTWRRLPEFDLSNGNRDTSYSAKGVVGTFVWGPDQSRAAGMLAPWNMWYTAFEREAWPTMLVGICHAGSQDGIRWVSNPANPVLRPEDPFRGQAGTIKRAALEKIYAALSNGEKEFSDIPAEERQERCWQMHMENSRVWSIPWVIYDDGVFRMWYSNAGTGRHPYRIGCADSRDGIRWEAHAGDIELDVSENGFDRTMVEYPCVIRTEAEWRLWYSGDGFAGIGYARAPREGSTELNAPKGKKVHATGNAAE